MLLLERNLKIFLVLNTFSSEVEFELWMDGNLLLANPDLGMKSFMFTIID